MLRQRPCGRGLINDPVPCHHLIVVGHVDAVCSTHSWVISRCGREEVITLPNHIPQRAAVYSTMSPDPMLNRVHCLRPILEVNCRYDDRVLVTLLQQFLRLHFLDRRKTDVGKGDTAIYAIHPVLDVVAHQPKGLLTDG